MMRPASLTGRTRLLACFVAVLATLACTATTAWVAGHGLDHLERSQARASLNAVLHLLRQDLADLERRAQMLAGQAVLSEGEDDLTVILGASGSIRQCRPAAGTVIPEPVLAGLLYGNSRSGILRADGRPLLFATRQLADRAEMVAVVRPLDLGRGLVPIVVTTAPAPPVDGVQVTWRDEALRLRGPDGQIILGLAPIRSLDRLLRVTGWSLLATGLIVALLATLLGSWLGWHWVRPIRELAQSCTTRPADDPGNLAVPAGPQEAKDLAQAFNAVLDRWRESQNDLATAWRQAAASARLRERVLALSQAEIAPALDNMAAIASRWAVQADSTWSDDGRRLEAQLHRIRERLDALRTLVAEDGPNGGAQAMADLRGFLERPATALAPLAARLGVSLTTDAPPESCPLPVEALTQVLIALLANALRAPGCRQVRLSARLHPDAISFEICDDGHGLPESLIDRCRSACVRGEVLPGEEGFGLGLPLALATARACGAVIALADTGPSGTRFVATLGRS